LNKKKVSITCVHRKDYQESIFL